MKDIAWSELSFGYMPTDYNVRCCYRNGKWGEIEVCSDEYLKIHMAATCLHYGQEAFEGLKAYRCPDGKVRLFRVEENAARLQSTCRGIMMLSFPQNSSWKWQRKWFVSIRSISRHTRAAPHFISVLSSSAHQHR